MTSLFQTSTLRLTLSVTSHHHHILDPFPGLRGFIVLAIRLELSTSHEYSLGYYHILSLLDLNLLNSLIHIPTFVCKLVDLYSLSSPSGSHFRPRRVSIASSSHRYQATNVDSQYGKISPFRCSSSGSDLGLLGNSVYHLLVTATVWSLT